MPTISAPVLGAGATIICGSDRYPATVCSTITNESGTQVVSVAYDDFKVISGSMQDGSAEYEFTPNYNEQIFFRKRAKDKRFHLIRFNSNTGRWNKDGSLRVDFSGRSKYEDPNF